MSTWDYKTLSFTYAVMTSDVNIDIAFQTEFDKIINTLNGTPIDWERRRIGANMRVTIMYKQNLP